MYVIFLYILIPLLGLIVALYKGWVNRQRVLAILCFFTGIFVGLLTSNLLAVEFFWVLALIFFKEWKIQDRGEGSMGSAGF